MTWMRTRISNWEREVKGLQADLTAERARPNLSSAREKYVIGELELANRQLDCKGIFLEVFFLQVVAGVRVRR